MARRKEPLPFGSGVVPLPNGRGSWLNSAPVGKLS